MAQLSGQVIVLRAEVRPVTGSVILLFDAKTVRAEAILDLVAKALAGSPLPAVSRDEYGVVLRRGPSAAQAACGLDCRACQPMPPGF